MDIRLASVDDAPLLARLARETFIDTFIHELGHRYPQEDLAAFLTKNYTPEFFIHSLTQGDALWIASQHGDVAGYAKAGKSDLPVADRIEPHGEIHRLYVVRKYQGQGIGKRLMQAMLEAPLLAQASAVYLGVWENNHPAQRFYARYGFSPVGEYAYYVGSHADREIILCKRQ